MGVMLLLWTAIIPILDEMFLSGADRQCWETLFSLCLMKCLYARKKMLFLSLMECSLLMCILIDIC
jgi:hypothetical protein